MSVVSAGILLYRWRVDGDAGESRADADGQRPVAGSSEIVGRREVRSGSGKMLEVWIAHMGGPFWGRKDVAAWSIPKGLVEAGEESLAAAQREFGEEIGVTAPEVEYRLLGDFRQNSGKIVRAYVAEAPERFDVDEVRSNLFTMEWPRGSGMLREFPEIDDARWVRIDEARVKLVVGQVALLDALLTHLGQ